MGQRDDFIVNIKDTLAKRVGVRCSNPNCRQPTSGPQDDPGKVLNIGVAAHITAASPNGPRYDARLTLAERRSPENGIWLCQNCGKLVDNDAKRYPADLLSQWKRHSEEAARLGLESPGGDGLRGRINDDELIRFFAQCFDRPAFQDQFQREGSMEAFDRAIEDTITALNTGCLRHRDGTVLDKAKGKSYLNNPTWRRQMDTIGDLLRAIRSRYDDARERGVIDGHNHYHYVQDPELTQWMDDTRNQVLTIFGNVCREASVIPPFSYFLPDIAASVGHR